MKGPQLEDGYTRIANEILEAAARLPVNATQFKILMVIWRYTYGFNRKAAELSQGFIAEATGVHKKQVQRELNSLIKKKIVIVEKEATFSSSRFLGFNKHHNHWVVSNPLPPNEKDTHTGSGSVASPGSGLATQERQYKDNLKERVVEGAPTPETTNPDKVPSHCQDDDPVLIFLNQVSSYYTTLTGRFTSPNDEVAITDISNLTVDFELVKQVMDTSKENFRPKYSGDRIRSFNFFVPAIKTAIAAEETRQKAMNNGERKMTSGEHSQGNIDRRTIELIKNSKKDWSAAELPEVNF